MALRFKTDTPKRLLATFKEAVDGGRAKNWKYDDDGDFRNVLSDWGAEAWLRPKIVQDSELAFFILSSKDTELSTRAYASYHSRMADAMLYHCDRLFSSLEISAMPEENDVI